MTVLRRRRSAPKSRVPASAKGKKLFVGSYNLDPMTPVQARTLVRKLNRSPVGLKVGFGKPRATTQRTYLKATTGKNKA